ncbi:hypothetical protein Pmani_007564 [Petrolisthes manimaculis]|uniref:Uncharacterized protein n=1 Tax=Petrolisthes manimaculis TaxID=1843537 RepID=A0AAE1UKN5_9EUCA|nr:hypothetical protein Pmani_007564 [Petrolisthes manimaculis]
MNTFLTPWTPSLPKYNATDSFLTFLIPYSRHLHIVDTLVPATSRYEIIPPPDGVFGGELPNGSWTGMIGMLQRKEVELALGPFTITRKREVVCDMSVPVAHDNKALFMVRPGIQSDMKGFLNTFTLEVWLMILVSMGAVSVAMMSLMWMEANVFNSTTRTTNIVTRSLMWTVQTLSQESSDWLPRRTEGRLLVTTWLLASLVFMSSYSGILTAMLTVPRVTIPIDSLADLVSQSRTPWRLEESSSMYQYFQDTTDGLRRQVFTGMGGVFRDCWKSRHDISEGNFVAVCDEITMKKSMSWDFSTTGRCHLYISREKIISVSSAVAFQAGSPYLTTANRIILSLRGGGLLDKWLSDHITNTSQCLRPPSTDRRDGIAALNLESLGGPFLFLAGGMCVGFLSLLCEVVITRASGGSRSDGSNRQTSSL